MTPLKAAMRLAISTGAEDTEVPTFELLLLTSDMCSSCLRFGERDFDLGAPVPLDDIVEQGKEAQRLRQPKDLSILLNSDACAPHAQGSFGWRERTGFTQNQN